jgi:translation initiation factor 2 subunit 1
LNEACTAIEAKIKESGGLFSIKMAPKVVTATDDADLAKQMEKAALENEEVYLSFFFINGSIIIF